MEADVGDQEEDTTVRLRRLGGLSQKQNPKL